MNQLTLADVLSEDALFATLDTTVRKLVLPSGLQVGLQIHLSFYMYKPVGVPYPTASKVSCASLLCHAGSDQ